MKTPFHESCKAALSYICSVELREKRKHLGLTFGKDVFCIVSIDSNRFLLSSVLVLDAK